LRDKYGPRIEAFHFESSVDVHEIKIFGDFAVMVASFDVTTSHKVSGEIGGGSGRLILGFRRDSKGDWKIALDVDNNG
jgi:ketosteroid isomerase-like protein